jgi:hypothetical protein
MHTAHVDCATDKQGKATEGLVLALLAGLAFLVLSLLRIYGDMHSALFDGEARIAPLEQPILGMELGNRLASFAGALLLVHLLLGLAAWGLAWLARRAWPQSRNSQRAWTALWFALGVIWILAANAAWFPSSSLGNPYADVVRTPVLGLSAFDLLSIVLSAAVASTVLAFALRMWRGLRIARPTMLAATAIVLLSVAAVSTRETRVWTIASAEPAQPNVIIIGLDSLRTDIVDGPDAARTVPALDAFLSQATVFTDTTTPLARTFSAWVSIITGRHPHTTGATVNLYPRDLIETGPTLPAVLRDAGYDTVYAIDEVRFSNIDESYGFDRMVGPRIGSADFLVEFFGDTPLSNLIVNTRAGDWLFPELHGNRAAQVTYDPDTFIDDIDRSLYVDSPTFLAVHLTLAHWPFTWARSEPQARGTDGSKELPELYDAAIRRLDTQFADLVRMLERKGALDDALVIVLSDHGESLGEPSRLADEVRQISSLLGKPEVFGHGTHVFSREQYQVVLGFRAYGDTPVTLSPGARVEAPASLEDITPTLVDALGIEIEASYDGRSLADLLNGHEPAILPELGQRIRFLETEFNPPGVSVEAPMSASAIARASASYRIDSVTDRLEVRREQLPRILASRQYAAVLGEHLLAAVPAANLDQQHLVYADSDAHALKWLDAPPDHAESPTVRRLWQALRERFEPVAARAIVGPPSTLD